MKEKAPERKTVLWLFFPKPGSFLCAAGDKVEPRRGLELALFLCRFSAWASTGGLPREGLSFAWPFHYELLSR